MDWITGKIICVKDIKEPSGFITFQDICNKIGNSTSRILKYNVVRAAVLHVCPLIMFVIQQDTELSDQPLFCNRKINMAKDFRKARISMHNSVPCENGFWSRKFGLEIDKHIRSMPSLVTKKNTRLGVLQWKVLHNIYPTNILLCKMKVRDDQLCSYCNDVVDYKGVN